MLVMMLPRPDGSVIVGANVPGGGYWLNCPLGIAACCTMGGGGNPCPPLAAFSASSFLFFRLDLQRQMARVIMRMAATPAPAPMPALAAVDSPPEGSATGYRIDQTMLTTAEVGLVVSVGFLARPAVRVGGVATRFILL